MLGALRKFFLGGVGPRVKLYVRAMVWCRLHMPDIVAKLIEHRLQLRYGVFLSHKARFGQSLDIKHPVGVVVGEGVSIGERVTIYQNVTLGGARAGDQFTGSYPVIGDDVIIYAGAIVVGPVQVGAGARIGANAVVTESVPPGCTAVGVPARVVGSARMKE